ncbi:hypothetical protein [Clostridium homopropionicum]|nr:hypothetical protein [Clostridium homopropionicum]
MNNRLSNLYDKNRKPLGKTHKIEQLCHDRLLVLTVIERLLFGCKCFQ